MKKNNILLSFLITILLVIVIVISGCPSLPVSVEETMIDETTTEETTEETTEVTTPEEVTEETTEITTEEEKAQPIASATFKGEIDISEKVAVGLTDMLISFIISEDSSSITSVTLTITFKEFKCENTIMSGTVASTLEPVQPYPITNGNFAISLFYRREMKGKFISSTKATGTIDVIYVFKQTGGLPDITCDLGTFNWSANAE